MLEREWEDPDLDKLAPYEENEERERERERERDVFMNTRPHQ